VRDRGGDLIVLGAAPAEHRVKVDLDAGAVEVVAADESWNREARELWLVEQRWTVQGDSLALRLRDEPEPVAGLVGDRVSGTALPDGDPALLGRARQNGNRCDTVLSRTTHGGRLFVAGTDRWTSALDEFAAHPEVAVTPAVDRWTAQVLDVARDSPLVSVVMTASEGAGVIHRAIDSVLGQTYRPLELIVVDDASRDGTFAVLLDYARRDPRVRPFRALAGRGPAWAKSFGITQARGELIAFQDGGEVSPPDRLRRQVDAMRRDHEADTLIRRKDAPAAPTGATPGDSFDPTHAESQIRDVGLTPLRVRAGGATVVGIDRPEAALPASEASNVVDVLMISDFRFPGGTSHSNAEEIKALARQGLTIGLVQVAAPTLKRDHPVNPVIRACVDAGLARWLAPGRGWRGRLVVVRHPTVLLTRGAFPTITADRLAVIVNQAPHDIADGRELYDLVKAQAAARRHFGMIGTWYPIGPLVRRVVEGVPGVTDLAREDWHNIIDAEEWRVERRGWVSDRPVLGRHSRDGAEKWPDTAQQLRLAYPDDGSVTVRILGGASHAQKLLGRLPPSWRVLDFNSIHPREFLAGIDFFVYYHHPGLAEAFGRAILEAIATGAVAILPPHFEVLFGEAAVYAAAEDVQRVVQELYRDRARYEAQSKRGVELVEQRWSHQAHARRVQALLPSATAGVRTIGTAEVEPFGAYKIEIELRGVPAEAAGTVRGVSRATGKSLFEIPVDSAPKVSFQFFTGDEVDQIDLVLAMEGVAVDQIDSEFSLRRRGERTLQPDLALGDTSITAALATYPGRREVAPEVIDRLLAQCEKVFVYLNNYDEIPSFVARHPERERIIFILDPASQKRAAAKFHWLDLVRGYHLLCDDDILYPPDYAKRMVEAIERHRRRAIVGVHGVVFEPEIRDARGSRRSTYKFPEALGAETPVHFLGTGTVALHSDVLPSLDLSKLDAYPIANDEILAVHAKKAGVPMICVAREAGWLAPHAGVKYGIFEERTIDTTEHDKASRLLASANPWPAPR
jgi:hypothetical protein